MTGNKRALGSDLAKVDAHTIEPAEYNEVPELGDDWFARAEPHEGGKPLRRGRPKAKAPKEPITIRLSAHVLDHFRATGPGWQSRIDAVLVAWVEEHDRQP